MAVVTSEKPFPGAVVHEDGRVTFTIYAPGMTSVHVIGDFNSWDREADPLEQDEGLWTISKTLDKGRYTYRFLVNGELEVFDPYAREIERDEDRPAKAVVRVGEALYPWKHDQFNRPNFEDLIISEILPYDFSDTCDFEGVRKRLGYLRKLGLNALQIMPVTASAADDEWGYQPVHFFAPHPEYGSPDQLRQLIDECHAHDMAVILDIVLAHTAHEHTFNKLYEYEHSPWYGRGFGAENEYGLPALDQSKSPTQAFIRDVLQFWLREYHIDGYRLDYVNLIDEQDGMGVPKMVQDIREARPDAYIVCEMLPEQPDKLSRWDIEGAYHWHFGESLCKLIMDDVMEDKLDYDLWGDFLSALVPERSGYNRARKRLNYTESHDEQRLVKKLRDQGLDGAEARHRAALAAAIIMTAPGEPLLYQAQEWGEKTPLDMDGNPLHWELLGSEGGRGLFALFRQMIQLRNDNQALRTDNFSLEYENRDQQCLAYQRWNDSGNRVLVAANFSPQSQQIELRFPAPGVWHEVIAHEDWEVSETQAVELFSHAAHVWVKK